MSTTFPPDILEFVQQELASGEFESESELMVRALEIYRELKAQHAELRARIQKSLAQADRGEVSPLDMDDVKAEVARRSAARRAAK